MLLGAAWRDAGPQPSASLHGLTSEEAAQRLVTFGPNEVRSQQTRGRAAVAAAQFASPVVLLLIIASAVSLAIGERLDAAAIGAIVLVNAWFGFIQEYRAERALLALRAMTGPRARVLRDGSPIVVAAREIVPGDALLLEAGDIVAADARLRDAHAFTVNEAPLTGESAPVDKSVAPVRADAPLAERHDAVFMGTAVTTGTASAEVTATGMSTELGRIAHLLQSAEREATPLQRRLAVVTRTLIWACTAIVAVIAAIGFARGVPLTEVFLTAISLAVAAVPEGLPAMVTVALAVGVQRMAARHVLVRKLPAIETLGCATVICTDKTGTLTTGVMTVRDLWGDDHAQLLFAAAACVDAEPPHDDRPGVGDPMELAILEAAQARGITREQIERTRPRVHVWPFDSATRQMAIERADGITYIKGAADVLLPRCVNTGPDAWAATDAMAARGLRVLAVATARDDAAPWLAGLIGLADPPRPEAVTAVAAAHAAGITTVMITGDHPTTARAIAHELGIDIADGHIHARATPEDKLRLVRDWKARGEVVAMTGDGVNDAPALREAHIGIAMGRTGTEVTREAADMILQDDSFTSIIAAIREGRGIFDNIRKALVYLLAGNASELTVMLVAGIVGLPLPLIPLQLLWINVVTDGLPALALVMDPAPPDALTRRPRRPTEEILGREQWISIAITAVLEATIVLAVFASALSTRGIHEARTLTFSVMVFAELFRAFAARSPTRVFWQTGVFSNLRLLVVIAASVTVQLAIHTVATLGAVFDLVPLSGGATLATVGAGLVPVTIIELRKLVRGWAAER